MAHAAFAGGTSRCRRGQPVSQSYMLFLAVQTERIVG
ncbi:hypothetical protein Ae263Ps1_1345c [Pseudonocardia sp. Ae263_Ps1]|nr:hypothetical protein Ae150APs1_3977 [Pseudonocardia sp. Ae150A_Ps1]OLL84290.1 hypothetical protein Ae263Ps1_1345c [Pseudonocardia sp. Ae263_Ps1]OLL95691.1 hypothetical protein Ae356Ps1_5588 [Pseudonocardia sp. Ae356_Ps1]